MNNPTPRTTTGQAAEAESLSRDDDEYSDDAEAPEDDEFDEAELAGAAMYAALHCWEVRQCDRLGLRAGTDIPAPQAWVDLMMGEFPREAEDFDFDEWEAVLVDGELKTVLVAETSVSEIETIALPCPWCVGTEEEVDDLQGWFETEGWDVHADLVWQIAVGQGDDRRAIDVPGMGPELQYVRDPSGGVHFLFRAGLSKARKAALLCIVLRAIADPQIYCAMQGAPE